MANTPTNGIPYVPENTQDPAAGLNLSLNVIDALIQTAVISMSLSAPPASPADGDMYVVAASPTGAWAGQANNVARYVANGDFWQFYAAGGQAKIVILTGTLYTWSGTAWVAASGSASGGTVTSVNVTASAGVADVLGVSGGPVTSAGTMTVNAVDPGADRILFWDDSESKLTYLSLGTNLSITGAVLNATGGGGGGGDVVGPASAVADRIAVFDGTTGKLIKDGGATIASLAYNTVSAVTITTGTATLNFASGTVRNFTLSMTANATLAVTGLAGAGRVTEFEMQVTQDATGSRTLTLPASFRALGGSDTAISSAANSVTVVSAKTFDNGTTWRYAMQESA